MQLRKALKKLLFQVRLNCQNRTTEVDLLLVKYVNLENNRYSLTISESEAIALGVTSEEYLDRVKIMREVNNSIEEAEERNDEIVFLPLSTSETKCEAEMPTDQGERYWVNDLRYAKEDGIKFTGHPNLAVYAGCTSFMWSVRVVDNTSTRSYTFSGFATIIRPLEIRIKHANQFELVNWNFTAYKGVGANCVTTLAFFKYRYCDCKVCSAPPGMIYDKVSGQYIPKPRN